MNDKPPQISKTADLARGAIMGALIGDAAGATIEFVIRPPTPDEIRAALRMSGGGVWRTAPGQITDDGELTLALCHGLLGEPIYRPAKIARLYRRWYLSNPFDVGHATANALREGSLEDPNLDQTIRRNALRNNASSKANGSLMRLSPLGVWAASVDIDAAAAAARMDAQLTHPHPTCQWAGAAYVVAIRHLLRNAGDSAGAFSAAGSILGGSDAREVASWLHDAKSGNLPAFHPQAGFVRIAFTHAFHHLHQATSYYEALAEVLSGGGDTDTNACIAGGLLGALHGEEAIPESMRSALLACDVEQGQPRPLWLRTTGLTSYIDRLIAPALSMRATSLYGGDQNDTE